MEQQQPAMADNGRMRDMVRADAARYYRYMPAPPVSIGWREVLRSFFYSRGFQAVCWYRLSHALYRQGRFRLAVAVRNWSITLTGCDISEACVIGPGLMLTHPVGIVLGAAHIGSEATILHQVTVGVSDMRDRVMLYPVIGDGVILGAGAKVLGPVTLGNRVTVGANAVVLESFPDDARLVGIPARPLSN